MTAERARDIAEDRLRAVRTGHGANCSSIGSVIDTLFATATVGAAIFAAVLVALKNEDVRVAGGEPEPTKDVRRTPPEGTGTP